jgi:glycosyltransferase involved in cell wall biosynthesis
VALDTGGTGDVIEHGTSGWLAHNVEELATGLRAVASDAELNARLRQGARQRAETRFAAPVVCVQVEELYRSLLERKGARL